MAYKVQVGDRKFHGLVGNLHMHTRASDGAKSHRELARLAAQAGLDFIVITDHNIHDPSQEGWVEDVLVLVGEEVHDPHRDPQASHALCFGIRTDMARYASDPQVLVNAVVAQGGFVFLAHPFERDAIEFLGEPALSWCDWQVEGFAGIELWNFMSEFKAAFKSKVQAVLYAYFPALAIKGPYPETRKKWDELLKRRRVSVLGGSDAHGREYRLGFLSKEVQPYEYLFRCVNTHLLISHPLSGDLDQDRAVILDALRRGRGFVGYEQPGATAGFQFWAKSGGREATMGEALELDHVVELRVTVPAPARLCLLRDGQLVAQQWGRHLALMSPHAGTYRLEVYRRHLGRLRGWIMSNPIYVQ